MKYLFVSILHVHGIKIAILFIFIFSELELHQAPASAAAAVADDEDSSDGEDDAYPHHHHNHHRHQQQPTNSSRQQHKTTSRARSNGSPFGRSRHTTPHASQRQKTAAGTDLLSGRPAAKQPPPSPLDAGYQTLEHSYDGESSLSSLDCQPVTGGGGGRTEVIIRSSEEIGPSSGGTDARLWSGGTSGVPVAIQTGRLGGRTRDSESRTARLEPGVSRHPPRYTLYNCPSNNLNLCIKIESFMGGGGVRGESRCNGMQMSAFLARHVM